MSEPEDLTPDEEQVRRLLADARHTRPLPDDVAARLDAVLADLRDDDPAVPVTVTGQPADLAAARRRRHNVRSWLVAAAAVVVVGIGVNQVAQLDVSGDSDSAADGGGSGSADRAEAGDSAAGGERENGQTPPDQDSPADGALASGPIRLDPDRFGTQVTRIQDAFTRARVDGGTTSYSTAASPSSTLPLLDDLNARHHAYKATCPTTGWGHGRAVPVRYDGRPGILVFRSVRGDTQVVDLFLCGSDQPERSITLPAP